MPFRNNHRVICGNNKYSANGSLRKKNKTKHNDID